MNYHLLPPVSGQIVDEEVANMFGDLSRVLQTGHQRLDSSAVSETPHGLPHHIPAEVLERIRFRERFGSGDGVLGSVAK